ncbi:hypothetical protein [Psychromonas sp. MME2]|uniref:hypothetical protein n=1 Tax=unclassified Psychromonas TaxID=2614957 RepID=UPI00339CF27D
MSKKIYLVKYEIEDDIPIDETSETLDSTYISDDLIAWLQDNEFLVEEKIKESKGNNPDIEVIFINDEKGKGLDDIFSHLENLVLKMIEDTASKNRDGVIVANEVDNDLTNIQVLLNVRSIIRRKRDKFADSPYIKLMLG